MDTLHTYVLNRFFLATFLTGSSSESTETSCALDPHAVEATSGSRKGDRIASKIAASSSYATKWRPLRLQAWMEAPAMKRHVVNSIAQTTTNTKEK